MKYLKIQNDGELDMRLISLMGGTTKANKKELIGNFGSGLKYTLAYLLRNNLDFHILIGENEVSVTTQREEIKDEVFDVIYIDGQRTSITANMGRDWEAWMIIRELWSNALDEGGAYREETQLIQGEKGKTVFFIQIDALIRKVLDDWGKYFIGSKEPLWENESYKIYNGGNTTRVYKQGVLIHEIEEPGLFSYDIKNATLNELREYKGVLSQDLSYCLKGLDDTKIIRNVLELLKENHFEGKMDWAWYNNFNSAWKDVIEDKSLVSSKIVEKMRNLGKDIPKNLIIVPEILYNELSKEFPYLSAVKIIKGSGAFYEEYNEQTESKVKQGLTILESCDYYIHTDLEFKFGLFENRDVLAKVDITDKVIMVSNTMNQKSLFSIIAMLIEENEHYNTGMNDETRAFQQHFIDLYTRQLLAKNEIEI